MEHNTGCSLCDVVERDICLDGTPRGYGIYEVNDNDVNGITKVPDIPKNINFCSYPVELLRNIRQILLLMWELINCGKWNGWKTVS
ncbi:hypothetical protein NXW94_30145 [Bacteroides ovatus]|nr:hypothetical protein [Bacteroides ovatus]